MEMNPSAGVEAQLRPPRTPTMDVQRGPTNGDSRQNAHDEDAVSRPSIALATLVASPQPATVSGRLWGLGALVRGERGGVGAGEPPGVECEGST